MPNDKFLAIGTAFKLGEGLVALLGKFAANVAFATDPQLPPHAHRKNTIPLPCNLTVCHEPFFFGRTVGISIFHTLAYVLDHFGVII